MVDQTIEITGASRARRIKRRFEAVITIEDPALPAARRVRFHRLPHPAHLALAFEDLDAPTDTITRPCLVGAAPKRGSAKVID